MKYELFKKALIKSNDLQHEAFLAEYALKCLNEESYARIFSHFSNFTYANMKDFNEVIKHCDIKEVVKLIQSNKHFNFNHRFFAISEEESCIISNDNIYDLMLDCEEGYYDDILFRIINSIKNDFNTCLNLKEAIESINISDYTKAMKNHLQLLSNNTDRLYNAYLQLDLHVRNNIFRKFVSTQFNFSKNNDFYIYENNKYNLKVILHEHFNDNFTDFYNATIEEAEYELTDTFIYYDDLTATLLSFNDCDMFLKDSNDLLEKYKNFLYTDTHIIFDEDISYPLIININYTV